MFIINSDDITFVGLYSFYVVEPKNFPLFKWQYRAGDGAGAEIMDTRGAKKEPEPRINNFSSATLIFRYRSVKKYCSLDPDSGVFWIRI